MMTHEAKTPTPQEQPTLQDELQMLQQEVPGFAVSVRTAIITGALCGHSYDNCVYGIMCQGKISKAIALATRVADQLQVRPSWTTPIQVLIADVHQGETHQTNHALKTLYDALQALS